MFSDGSYTSWSTIYYALYGMKCKILDFRKGKGTAVFAIEKNHAIFYGIEN